MGTSAQMEALKENERLYLYWLVCTEILGAVSIQKLYEHFGSYERIYNMEEKELAGSGIIKNSQAEALPGFRERFGRCQEEFYKMKEQGIHFAAPGDEAYPKRLLEIHGYPMLLFAKGRLPSDELPSVAIVGARACSAYGEQLTDSFARTLASEQVQIISGLATGIDGASHKGTLSFPGGRTFGVLGCGINICYPRQNFFLYEAMQQNGGVLTEFPPGSAPLRQHFPMRNRIISGLSDAVLVVEAREKSGSLITAELGLEQGREVFAVPGRITDNLSMGCNQLIAQGAQLASSPDDILEYLGMKRKKKFVIQEKNIQRLAKKEKKVYSLLDFSPRHLDEIASKAGLPASECMEILFELELNGYAFHASNQYYGRKV